MLKEGLGVKLKLVKIKVVVKVENIHAINKYNFTILEFKMPFNSYAINDVLVHEASVLGEKFYHRRKSPFRLT